MKYYYNIPMKHTNKKQGYLHIFVGLVILWVLFINFFWYIVDEFFNLAIKLSGGV